MVVRVRVLVLVLVRQHTVVLDVQYVRSDIILVKLINLFMFIAVCSPACSNGGTCSSPGTCTCPSTYTGSRCGTRKISQN